MIRQEIEEPWLHPAPDRMLFLSQGAVLRALVLPPGSVLSVQQTERCLGLGHLLFTTLRN